MIMPTVSKPTKLPAVFAHNWMLTRTIDGLLLMFFEIKQSALAIHNITILYLTDSYVTVIRSIFIANSKPVWSKVINLKKIALLWRLAVN